MSEEILIGRWDCSSCGTRGVMGDSYRCHSCGAGRPDDVEFYLPGDAEVVKDKAGIAAAKAGSDWMCEYCHQWVAAVEKECPNCAGGKIAGSQRQKTADLDVAALRADAVAQTIRSLPPKDRAAIAGCVETLERLKEDEVQVARRSKELAAMSESVASISRPSIEQPRRRRLPADDMRSLLGCVGFAAMLSLIATVGWLIFRTTTAVAVISAHSWTRVQHVEEYTTLSQEGWDHPSDAYNVRSERREHHKERILDHYDTKWRTVRDRVADGTERVQTGTRTRNLGNGRFKREPTYETRTRYKTIERRESYRDPVYRYDPVYRDYYHYLVDRWVPGADRREHGVGLDARWPSTAVRDAKQRMGSRDESYSLSLLERSQEPGAQARTWTRTFDETTWRGWRDGTVVVVTLRLGDVIEMKAVEAGQ